MDAVLCSFQSYKQLLYTIAKLPMAHATALLYSLFSLVLYKCFKSSGELGWAGGGGGGGGGVFLQRFRAKCFLEMEIELP